MKNNLRKNLLLSFLLLLSACSPSSSPPTPPAKPDVDIYPMRGIIMAIPTSAMPHQLSVRHEASKDMESMTMPFTADDAVSLKDLAIGDKVSFTYEINWKTHTERITKLEKLPADTVLNIDKPAPAK